VVDLIIIVLLLLLLVVVVVVAKKKEHNTARSPSRRNKANLTQMTQKSSRPVHSSVHLSSTGIIPKNLYGGDDDDNNNNNSIHSFIFVLDNSQIRPITVKH
jgi:hypothetical protein